MSEKTNVEWLGLGAFSGMSDPVAERLNDTAGFAFDSMETLEDFHTGIQRLTVIRTKDFGRVMLLDGSFMTSQGEEFFYHESLAHPVLCSHENPRSVLVIGGGDGGLAEEALKHGCVESLVLCELDEKVVEMSKKWFPQVHNGVFSNPRLRLLTGDGRAFVESGANGLRFDVIILDLTDPIGPVGELYSSGFLLACKRLLNKGGAMAFHLGVFMYQAKRVSGLFESQGEVFSSVAPYLSFMPLYGALSAFAVSSDVCDPRGLSEADVDERLASRGVGGLELYSGAVHKGMFALPKYAQGALGKD